jgi:hypothetical protein
MNAGKKTVDNVSPIERIVNGNTFGEQRAAERCGVYRHPFPQVLSGLPALKTCGGRKYSSRKYLPNNLPVFCM